MKSYTSIKENPNIPINPLNQKAIQIVAIVFEQDCPREASNECKKW